MSVLLFPGQGTQYVGMGMALLRAFSDTTAPIFTVAERARPELMQTMRRGPAGLLARTENAQPAVTAVNLAASAVLRAASTDEADVSAVAGHSVGLLAALVRAEALGAETALALAAHRGALMGALPGGGGMVAVRGLSRAEIDDVTTTVLVGTAHTLVVGLVNAAHNIVLSGDLDAVDAAACAAADKGAIVTRLAVSHAFHSPLMRPARSAWAAAVAAAPVSSATVPVISDLTGEPCVSASSIRELLVAQLTTTVRWDLVVGRILAGADRSIVEVGDSTTLRAFARAHDLHVDSMRDSGFLSGLLRRRRVHA